MYSQNGIHHLENEQSKILTFKILKYFTNTQMVLK